MSSACTCHNNEKECEYCKDQNGFQVTLIDGVGHVLNVYKNGKTLNFYAQDITDDESTEIALDQKQIKELMLFLDRKYGYLLEGTK